MRFAKNDKSPGSDGYINEFYKAFSDQMTSLLATDDNHWSMLHIKSVKRGRPIAQNDYRLLTSILAKREGTAVKHIIHPDLTGFITN